MHPNQKQPQHLRQRDVLDAEKSAELAKEVPAKREEQPRDQDEVSGAIR